MPSEVNPSDERDVETGPVTPRIAGSLGWANDGLTSLGGLGGLERLDGGDGGVAHGAGDVDAGPLDVEEWGSTLDIEAQLRFDAESAAFDVDLTAEEIDGMEPIRIVPRGVRASRAVIDDFDLDEDLCPPESIVKSRRPRQRAMHTALLLFGQRVTDRE